MKLELLQTANQRINMVPFLITEIALPERNVELSYALLSRSIGRRELGQTNEAAWCSGWAAFDQASGRLLLYVSAAHSAQNGRHEHCSSNFNLTADCFIPENELMPLGIREGDLYFPARTYPAIHLNGYALLAVPLCRIKKDNNTFRGSLESTLRMAL